MFLNLIKFPIESELLQWEAKQVLRDIHKKPHLFLRIKLTGTSFPLRALDPLVKVGDITSKFVIISEDLLEAFAYFDKPIPLEKTIEFGYEDGILLRFPNKFDRTKINLLDFKRLPKMTQNFKKFFPNE